MSAAFIAGASASLLILGVVARWVVRHLAKGQGRAVTAALATFVGDEYAKISDSDVTDPTEVRVRPKRGALTAVVEDAVAPMRSEMAEVHAVCDGILAKVERHDALLEQLVPDVARLDARVDRHSSSISMVAAGGGGLSADLEAVERELGIEVRRRLEERIS